MRKIAMTRIGGYVHICVASFECTRGAAGQGRDRANELSNSFYGVTSRARAGCSNADNTSNAVLGATKPASSEWFSNTVNANQIIDLDAIFSQRASCTYSGRGAVAMTNDIQRFAVTSIRLSEGNYCGLVAMSEVTN